MSAETINISHDPVKNWERFLLSLGPDDFYAYQDDDRAMGGFWSCSFKIRAPEIVLQEMFENGLGRHVEVWGSGLELLHEGKIFELVYNLPPDQYVMSLDTVVNKIKMRVDYDADGVIERSTVIENTDSQAKFGIKEMVMSGGELNSLSVADQATQQFIDLRAFPRPSLRKGAGRGDPYIEVFSRGYIATCAWQVYNQTADTGTQGASAQIEDIIDASCPYVAKQAISSNSTVVTKEYDADRKALDIMNDIAQLGDANNNRWVIYMTKGRELHYTQAAPATVT